MAWIDDRKEDDWWVETCSKGPQVEFKPWAAAARTDEYLLRLYSSHHFSFKNLHLQSGLSFLFSVLRHINVELQKNEYERRAVDHCCCRLFLRQQTNMPLRRSSDYGGNTEYIGLQEPYSFWNSKFGWWRGWKNPSCFPVTKTPLATYCGMNGFLVQRAVCVCFCCWLVSCYAWVTQLRRVISISTHFKRMHLVGFWLRGRGVPLFITCQTVTSGQRGINTTICLPVNFLNGVSHGSSSLAPLCVHCSLCFSVLTALWLCDSWATQAGVDARQTDVQPRSVNWSLLTVSLSKPVRTHQILSGLIFCSTCKQKMTPKTAWTHQVSSEAIGKYVGNLFEGW